MFILPVLHYITLTLSNNNNNIIFLTFPVPHHTHTPNNNSFDPQRITSTVDSRERQYLLMDLDVSMRSGACPYTVHFYGALFRDGDVWICMEVMETSLDKFYPKVFSQGKTFPEEFLGKIAFSVRGGGLCGRWLWCVGVNVFVLFAGEVEVGVWFFIAQNGLLPISLTHARGVLLRIF